jgi:hypothetical protein
VAIEGPYGEAKKARFIENLCMSDMPFEESPRKRANPGNFGGSGRSRACAE